MDNLYGLTKRIDALTYNSQQVLNALVRSCIASGSSSGYRVVKYGNKIELTRADIYHLYNFYESWKAEGFPSGSAEFYSLLSAADARWGEGSLATEAVAKHSKILYLNDGNASRSDETEYWTELIRESASPNATVSSAPIPLNLRTPLYDENLSVKSFSQYETYLFPMGYYRNEILGTPGNGESYLAGGKDWTIDASGTLKLNGNHIVMGSVSNPDARVANYLDSVTTLSWGDESYAVGSRSLALGNRSVAVGDDSASLCTESVSYGRSSLAIGYRAKTLGMGSLSACIQTVAGGASSVALNGCSVTGGWAYKFTMKNVAPVSEDTAATCPMMEYDEETRTCVPANSTSVYSSAASSTVLVVTAYEASNAALPFNIKVGDYVNLYDLSYVNSSGMTVGPTSDAGYAARLVSDLVTDVTAMDDGSYQITLKNGIVPENKDFSPVVSGMIAATTRKVKFYGDSGQVIADRSMYLGEDSAALNYYTIASGARQTVVGSMNVPNYEANFIVGSGTSYIETERYRANTLLVSKRYSYMKLANGEAGIGVSTVGGAIHDGEGYKMYNGAFLVAGNDTAGESLVWANAGVGMLRGKVGNVISGTIGVANKIDYFSKKGGVRALVQALTGNAVITTGNVMDTMLVESEIVKSGERSIGIYSADGIEIKNGGGTSSGRGIRIDSSSYLVVESDRSMKLTFDSLILSGDTYGALTADSSGRSFWLTGSNPVEDGLTYAHEVSQSGFYYGIVGQTDFKVAGTSWTSGTKFHMFNSYADMGSAGISTATLTIPWSQSMNIYRPVVTVSRQGRGVATWMQSKELAYADEVSKARVTFGNCSTYGYSSESPTTVADLGPTATGNRRVLPVLVRCQSGNGVTWAGNAPYDEDDSTKIWLEGRFANGGSKKLEIIRSDSRFDTPIVSFDNIKYGLVDNVLTLTFAFTNHFADANIDTMYGSNVDKTNGIMVPFMLDCGVEYAEGMSFESVVSPDNNMSLRCSMLSGTMQYYDANNAITRIYTISALAFEDGMILLAVVTPDKTKYFSDDATASKVCRVTLTGVVPFRATAAGCAELNSTERAQSVATSVSRNRHFRIQDWDNRTDYGPVTHGSITNSVMCRALSAGL